MAKEYTAQEKEKDMKEVFVLLHKKTSEGKIKLDDLYKDMDDCPFCGTKAEIVTKKKVLNCSESKARKDGYKKIKVVKNTPPGKPQVYVEYEEKQQQFIVDRDHLTYRTRNCCGAAGGPISYVMLTHCRGKTKDDRGRDIIPFRAAIGWLRKFCSS